MSLMSGAHNILLLKMFWWIKLGLHDDNENIIKQAFKTFT